jgi:hypothetical protein
MYRHRHCRCAYPTPGIISKARQVAVSIKETSPVYGEAVSRPNLMIAIVPAMSPRCTSYLVPHVGILLKGATAYRPGAAERHVDAMVGVEVNAIYSYHCAGPRMYRVP